MHPSVEKEAEVQDGFGENDTVAVVPLGILGPTLVKTCPVAV